LSVSATITGGWSGVFAGEITVTNLGNGFAGTDWRVAVVMDAPLTLVSNFDVQSELRSDGRYDVSISPKSWAAPLAPGASQASYYQAAGEFIDPAQVFDFTESAVAGGVVDHSSAAADLVAAQSTASTPMVEPTVATSVDVQVPNGGSDKRIVTYFEEWGVYERDINLSDVNGQAMTHLNYSFFDVKADGSVELFDAYAAQEKRFDAADQVSRTFTTAEYQAVDPVLIAAYNSDRYTITETADSVTVTSVPVGWNDAGPQDAGNFEQLSRFKELNPNVELGFALGGWTLSDEFSTAFATQAGRDQFTSDVVDIFKTYEFFSVVDFDWEYPGGGGDAGNASSANDGANFALVLEQLRSELDALELQTGGNYEVSIATAGGSEKLANLNLSGIDPYVDFYNVMTYDFHGGWENQTGHQAAMTGDANNYDVTSSVSVFEEAGVALNKVVLGAPAYTRAWGGVEDGGTSGYQQSGTGAAAQGSFEAGVYDYKDIVSDVITGQTNLYWDDNSKAAFAYNGDEWSSIETTATIAGKAAYVQEKNIGGMMFWALSNDAEGDLSLVETASDLLLQGGSYSDAIGNAPEFDTILGGNGEFSISDFTTLA
ncbi:glycosyl hydrolase family 18 protein, partial [Synechococcus sp. AH-707-B22]|nr:glycosyl hydrolase family 18 protein [Synechococcus sp. AH-707-B22]